MTCRNACPYFMVHNFLDACLNEQLGTLIAGEQRHIDALQQHTRYTQTSQDISTREHNVKLARKLCCEEQQHLITSHSSDNSVLRTAQQLIACRSVRAMQ
eukprot:GHRR01029120.1.p2 GENE.GHRR01029120.1~~GHRR01029120.1.p2  ORF type:complete len:100 (+),score=30.62 GHRR01029120.1:452-751(+)